MKFVLGVDYLVTMKPGSKAGIWQKLIPMPSGSARFYTGPATINESEVLLLRPCLAENRVSEAQATAWRESLEGLPEWTRTDIALDLDIAGEDIEKIHVFRCREGVK